MILLLNEFIMVLLTKHEVYDFYPDLVSENIKWSSMLLTCASLGSWEWYENETWENGFGK